MYNINSHCFNFKNINLKNGIFDNFIDATYVITLEKSKRHESMYRQLYKYKPSSNIFIYMNKGFENCKKKLVKQNTSNDLTNSNYNILIHAQKNNFNNILVLEDDFLFNNRILNKEYTNDIKNFITSRKNTELFCYSLGSLPILFKNIYGNHYDIFGLATHSIIYPKQTINKLIDYINYLYENNKNNDIDMLNNKIIKRYIYKIPLCCQTFPETKNSKSTWPIILQHLVKIGRKYLSIDKKDKIFEAYDKIYNFLKYFQLILILIIIFFLLHKFSFK